MKDNLLNNYLGLIIAHTTIILPFLSWMLVSFYSRDIFLIESAARSEGATRFQAFYMVALPLIAPGLIAAGLLGFILSWNEFIFVLILIQILLRVFVGTLHRWAFAF